MLTHSFRGGANSLVNFLDRAVDARKRGILFDVGHGIGSFSFGSARPLLEWGFIPDTVSSDLHVLSMNMGVDLVSTVNKFPAIDLPIEESIRSVTLRPAKILGLSGGSLGELEVFEVRRRKRRFMDVEGSSVNAEYWLELKSVLKGISDPLKRGGTPRTPLKRMSTSCERTAGEIRYLEERGNPRNSPIHAETAFQSE